MPFPRAVPILLVFLAAAGVALAALPAPPPAPLPSTAADVPEPLPKVKLAVLVVFDQMRGDYVDKWRPLFGAGGFRRMQADGAWFVDCHYPYGTTTTGPGHASILAGCAADRHGIVNNEWFDRAAGKGQYCAASTRYSLIPPTPVPVGSKAKAGGCPDFFHADTLADVVKAGGDGGKVFGLSLKDRSAVLPTGKNPDGVYWFEGRFVTSTYYRDGVHPWVAAFNKSGFAESFFGRLWNKLRSDIDYEKYSGPDNGLGEGSGAAQGKTFPHPTTGGKTELGPEYYEALAKSPFGSEVLLALAKTCILEEKLGQRDTSDLLTVSFSSNDLIGHTWGPDSQEVLDVTLRSDVIMADLLSFLDETVGPGNFAVLVTADHGICPIPEVSVAKGRDAGRLSSRSLVEGVKGAEGAEKFLQEVYGHAPLAMGVSGGEVLPGATSQGSQGKWIEAFSPPNVYLNRRHLAERNINPSEAADKLAGWLRTQPGIERAYSRSQLLDPLAPASPTLTRTRASFDPARSGDVLFVIKPYYLIDVPTAGTTHGTPHEYDTHTPFLVYGPGLTGGPPRTEPVTPLHAAPVLAAYLGVRPPKDCQYGVPRTLARPW
ncbi:alkaline phosphatase family protein [Fimbriiglobus ruber]|uniref:Alkaline phosphatase n=1 Tax=Fimbriiglobus ruber TaxID=1908690 RepID=A0A225DZI5_9BACT|nr:alkaline phosphatase family protein [Fimbriiglobus ruber]OWK43948.1 Alkaline phosphatase [Fimbriiglobus ruber]